MAIVYLDEQDIPESPRNKIVFLDEKSEETPKKQLPGFDEESKPKNWILSGLTQTKRDLVDVPKAHFVNQYALNLPRAVASKLGYEYPEAESAVGNVLAKTAGVVGGIVNPLSTVKKISEMKAGAGLLSKIVQGAKAGAIQGSAYTPTDDIVGVQQRASSGLIGGALGAVGSGVSELFQKGVRTFRKFKNPAKVSTVERINYKQEDLRNDLTKSIEEEKTVTKDKIQKLNDAINEEKLYIEKVNKEANDVIKENILVLKNEFQSATEEGAIDVQKRLPDFFRANSDAYGKALDSVSDEVGERLTAGIADNIIEKTVKDLDEAYINTGKGRKIVDALAKKYSLTQVDSEGNIISQIPESTPVSFKAFKKDISSVWKSILSQAKAGEKFSEEDLAAAFLQNNFGEYVSKEVPSFVELQSTYKPVLRGMKEAGKFFKPYAGDFTNIRGGKLFERIAQGKATPQEENLMQFLAKGSKYAEGLGDVTRKAKEIATKIDLLEKAVKTDKNSERLQSLIKEQKALSKSLRESIVSSKTNTRSRIERLEMRKRKVKQLEAEKKKWSIIKGTSGTIGGVGAFALRRKIYNTIMPPNRY